MKHLALFSYNKLKTKDIMPRKKNYLNNKDLYAEIVISKEEDKLTRKAEKMLAHVNVLYSSESAMSANEDFVQRRESVMTMLKDVHD